jgi:RNA polymerase sigma-70 factor (ECF subfamily)
LSASDDQLLHERLLAGDPTAPSDLAQQVLQPVTQRLRRRFPTVRDKSMIDDAAVDAILNYAERPSQFDPAKSSLLGYLTLSARGDLLNALEAQKSRWTHEESLENVDFADFDRKIKSMGNESAMLADDIAVDNLAARRLLSQLRAAADTPRDLAILQLMINGEKRTEIFAQALGLTELSLQAQKSTVKRHKDRLKKRLQRLGIVRDE